MLDAFRWTGGHADFAGVLRSERVLATIGAALVEPFRTQGVTGVLALEARGFAFGALAANALGVGLVLARKPGGVHPDAAETTADGPDWRGHHQTIRISRQAVRDGDRLLLVDDWIETDSQARTVARLVAGLGAVLVGVAPVVDDTTDAVRAELGVVGVLRGSELPPA